MSDGHYVGVRRVRELSRYFWVELGTVDMHSILRYPTREALRCQGFTL